jgi:tannase/feruloyl esterase
MATRMPIAILVAVVAASSYAAAQNGSQFSAWTPAVLGDAAPVKPTAACDSLAALAAGEVMMATPRSVEASGDVPAHCHVSGRIQPEVRFELVLPDSWNGRLYMFGNGGYAGEALDSAGRVAARNRALSRGFAVVDTNTGHDGRAEPLGTFAADSQKFIDYAHRAVHETVATAKRAIATYYGGALRHSYFDGCSTGGREGLISAQRYPEDFDGIVAGAPVLDFTSTMISYVWNQKALSGAHLSVEQMRAVSERVYAACDAADGLKDGVIDDPRRCAFSPARDLPRCAGDAAPSSCFTPEQIQALESVYGGVRRRGAEFFPGQPPGAETGWAPWLLSTGSNPPIETAFGQTFFRYLAFGRPSPDYDWTAFNVETDLDKLQTVRRELDATNPDLSRFKTRGGRMITYFGWADPALNPLMGVRYYQAVTKEMGPSTTDFYRLFMVPGMQHCSGGVGTDKFDAFTALVEWVERGVAPASIPASRVVDGNVVRTRPLCPYPQVATYSGTGSIDDAANFTCAAPARVPAYRP